MTWDSRFTSTGLITTGPYDLMKARYAPKDPKRTTHALLENPLDIAQSVGYKDRMHAVSYDILRRIPHQLGIVAAIIQTRCYQVGAFSSPYRLTKSIGYEVRHVDPSRKTTDSDKEKIQSIERFIYNCGSDKENPYSDKRYYRDDFETFLKKVVRDSLTYDALTFEIVPSRGGSPFEFAAVDSATIRIASKDTGYFGDVSSRKPPVNRQSVYDEFMPFNSLRLTKEQIERPAYVQVVNGQIHEVFTREELAFGVRNPRTDMLIRGYGTAETEMIINTITSILYAEEYNARIFKNGAHPKGILNFKGDEMAPEMLEAFKRQWQANVSGVNNVYRTPILQSEGIEWIDMQKSNADMEYGAWLEYLIKICSAAFQIDPAEINFDLSGGVSQTPLFESSQEWKLKASRDKGLKPLLKFVAKMINKHIVEKIDKNFVFDFVGLDELTEQEKHQLRTEQLASYMTLNEVRRAQDLADIDPDSDPADLPLNPTYIQALSTLSTIKQQENQAKQQEEQMQQQQQAQAQPPGGQPTAPQQAAQETPPPNEQVQEESQAPAYAGRFFKSLEDDPVEYDDSWIDLLRGD